MIRASAPVRLDFAGAWTDVAPFATQSRGVVVNAAIDLRTRVELTPNQRRYHLRADDLDEQIDVATLDELGPDGTLDLLKAAIRRSGLGPCSLRTSAEAPPGSGLGTSGALSVALTAAIGTVQGHPLNPLDIAHQAWQMETVDAAVAGGQQDQYAAAVGGFQHLTFDHGTTTARSLQLDPAFARELAEHIVVCYTGRSRFSGNTITQVMGAYTRGDGDVVAALESLVEIAEAMTSALVSARLEQVGELLAQNWLRQQQLAPGMRTAEMARLEMAMSKAGSIGAKAAGSGAGGAMFFLVPGPVHDAIATARACGATVLPTTWADRGVSID